ncbi:para-nitrobenzyl esterase [Sinobacterium caligoides]|uniref:Carboxylic ester hydrolase n=1 Tax=Sinobacterium caligoides TaxID=933926 RepID=A0A3N2DZP6_9GAMM|nr:carboxylesterase family protein [Sinobacterium caligoides]ROS05314.1 para-nitrobenzyl esterase [Sinobacterium caligoides]
MRSCKTFSLLLGSLLLAITVLSTAFAQPIYPLPSPDLPTVELDQGVAFSGERLNKPSYHTSIEVFRGIRYAQGERFEHSKLFQYPPGRHDVRQFGAICPQKPFDLTAEGIEKERQSEDCLSLNIWRPAGISAEDALLPVYVFIHGGAFEFGSGSAEAFRGDEIVAMNAQSLRPFIVVSMNYRLGLLGSFHPQVPAAKQGGSDEEKSQSILLSGNYGLGDQRLALRWVQSNIKSFGGDASNVTVFGESAGAMSVGIHLLDHKQNGTLYQHAIMESNPYGIRYKNEASAQALADKIRAHSKKPLNELTVEEIIKLQQWSKSLMNTVGGLMHSEPKTSGFLTYAPYLDGALLPMQPSKISKLDNVDVILGFNSDESNIFIAPLELTLLTRMSYRKTVRLLFGRSAGDAMLKIDAFNPRNTPMFAGKAARVRMARNLLNNVFFKCANREVAKRLGGNVSLYNFSYKPTFNLWPKYFNKAFYRSTPKGETSSHGAELPFIFGHELNIVSGPVEFSAEDRQLKEMLMSAWFDRRNFPPYDREKDNILTINLKTPFRQVDAWDSSSNDGICEQLKALE